MSEALTMDERFREIAALAADWDGEGAEKPSEAAIANARRFLQELATMGEPSIGPCADGSIDLWWSPNGRKYLLINFTSSGTAGFCSEIGGMKFKGSAHSAKGDEHAG